MFIHLGKHRNDGYWSVVITLLWVVYFRNRRYSGFFPCNGKSVLSNTFVYDVRYYNIDSRICSLRQNTF